MPDAIAIVRGRAELLDAVRPLWLALRDHHHALAPEMGRIRSDHDTWQHRRGQYAEWLHDDRAFFLVARRDRQVLAYAFVRPVTPSSATWQSDGRPALDLETLSVAPAARGAGLGARLLALVREEVARGGYADLYVTAVAKNVDALRFYEREGFAPGFVSLRDTTRRP